MVCIFALFKGIAADWATQTGSAGADIAVGIAVDTRMVIVVVLPAQTDRAVCNTSMYLYIRGFRFLSMPLGFVEAAVAQLGSPARTPQDMSTLLESPKDDWVGRTRGNKTCFGKCLEATEA